jgi:hypothetical protein
MTEPIKPVTFIPLPPPDDNHLVRAMERRENEKRVIESMTQIVDRHGGFRVRVWRQEDSLRSVYNNEDILEKVQSWTEFKKTIGGWFSHELADFILKMERVNAVEVVDKFGNGIVLYSEWP